MNDASIRAAGFVFLAALAALATGGCGSSGPALTVGDAGTEGGAGACQDGGILNTTFCDQGVAVSCEKGTRVDCSADGRTCQDGLGCVVCTPGASSCENAHAKSCRADGSGFDEFDCDALQGMTCEPGGCRGTCTPTALAQSYIGCDYYPTVTLNPVWSGFSFAVAVGNTSEVAAKVTVTRGTNTIAQVTVQPHALGTIPLPWVTELKGGDVDACQTPPDPGPTRVVAAGAYRLRSTVPVTAYQLSPLDYKLDPAKPGCPLATMCGGTSTECLSYSNDASLLLPTNTLTKDYAILAWPSTTNRAGFVAVTATQDDTQVELLALGELAAGAGFDSAGKGKVTLARGDVLQVIARHDGGAVFGSDVSGTRVRASRPVQVTSGHSCANAPLATTGFCDHLEEVMFPAETLGKDYLITIPSAEVGDSPHEIRVIAVQEQTKVHFDPPIVPDAVLKPGELPLQILNVTQDVHVVADKPILVGQYMPGSTSLPSPVGSGDPSLSLGIPTAQFRSDYVFVASHTYFVNYVNVIAKTGTSVTLDGAVIPSSEFKTIGASGYAVARHKLSQSDVHTIRARADEGFGIVVYGYGKDTSYMYPGGLDLNAISPTPIH